MKTIILILLSFAMLLSCDYSAEKKKPEIRKIKPEKNITVEEKRPVVEIYFSDTMNKETVESSFTMTSNSLSVKGSFYWKENCMKFIPGDDVLPGAYYIVIEESAENVSGVNIKERFVNKIFISADRIKPVISAIFPDEGQEISPSGEIVLSFSEPISKESIIGGYKISPSASFNITFNEDSSVVKLKPVTPLQLNTMYFIKFNNSISDIAGNPLFEEKEIYFKTGDSHKSTAVSCMIGNTVLADRSLTTGIEKDPVIIINSSNNADYETLKKNISVYPDTPYVMNQISGTQYQIVFEKDLFLNKIYTFTIKSSFVDLTGNSPVSSMEYPFLIDGINSSYITIVKTAQVKCFGSQPDSNSPVSDKFQNSFLNIISPDYVYVDPDFPSQNIVVLRIFADDNIYESVINPSSAAAAVSLKYYDAECIDWRNGVIEVILCHH